MAEPTGPETAAPPAGTGSTAPRDASNWATKVALGKRLGVADPAVQTRSVCLDPQRQWRRAGNVWQNSMARSVLQTVVSPLAAPRRRRRRSRGQPAAS